MIIHALGLPGDSRAAMALCKVTGDVDECSGVRGEAAEALSCFSSPKVRSAVCRCLLANLKDKNPEVRYFSVYSIGLLRCSSALNTLADSREDSARVESFGSIADEVQWAIEMISGGKAPRSL
jgi:hypothetical protein